MPDRVVEDFPLFPLGLVALPFEYVPLHIFEDRYRTMIDECLERDTEFGIVWASDEEICNWMLARLDLQLARVQDAKALLAVIHVLPFAELVQRGAFGPVAFHDAWLGSPRLGELLRRQPNLRAVVCGHLHRPADLTLNGIRVYARPVGNAAHSPLPLVDLAAARMGILEVDC